MIVDALVDELERRLEILLNGTEAARHGAMASPEEMLDLIRRWRMQATARTDHTAVIRRVSQRPARRK